MNLEQLVIRARLRSDWEAVDLGLLMTRRWWRLLYRGWLLVTLPLSLLLVVLLGGWGLVVLWWLFPLVEPIVVLALSQLVFGVEPKTRDLLRSWSRLLPRRWPELWWRRFTPSRSARLPVGLLEGLRGGEWRQRVRVLRALGDDTAGWLSLVFLLLELGTFVGLVFVVVFMIPSWSGVDWADAGDRLFEGTLPIAVYRGLMLFLAWIWLALRPFYLAAGFSLYLNRRMRLEGWDLEIAFRRLARRLRVGGRRLVQNGAAAAVCLFLLAGVPAAVRAAPKGPSERVVSEWLGDEEGDPRRVIRRVFDQEKFDREETVRRWRLREELWPDTDLDGVSGPPSWGLALGSTVAALIEPLFWLLVAAVLVFILVVAWRRWPGRDRATAAAPRPVEQIAGLDVRPASLPRPSEIPVEAERLWQQGQWAAALSLLYRGVLAQLVDAGIELHTSFTEGDCLRAARRELSSEKSNFLAELTRAWRQTAYAHRTPETSVFLELSSGWKTHFGAPR